MIEAVRPAVTGDLDRLGELLAAFDDGVRLRRGGDKRRVEDGGRPPGAPDDVGEYLFRADRTALVGTLDGWVAGMALCRRSGDPGSARGALDACYVEPGAREVGLGHLLLEACLAWFAEQGCTGVDGVVHPGDRGAKQFFERAGFTARLLVMHRPLA